MSLVRLENRRWVGTLDGLLNLDECEDWIARAESEGFSLAPITTAWGFLERPEFRNNRRAMWDAPDLAHELWERARANLPAEFEGWRACGLNERLRVYRYDPGQYFRWHFDGAYVRNRVERSMLTFMVYLNADFLGGRTEFDPEPRVEPRPGRALVFEHPIRHQGAEVLEGRKYVLRTDVMFRAPGC